MRLLPRLSPLLLILALTGCQWWHDLVGPDRDEFAPPCPRPTMVRDLADIVRFRADNTRDPGDMVIQGRVLNIGGSCRFTAKGSLTVEVSVTVSAEFRRGPAMQGSTATIPVFLAVADGNTVLDKKVIDFPVEFPSNVDRVTMTSQTIELTLPSTREKSPAAFSIIGGFQLTPAELSTNKQGGAVR
jgi:hypothetical protein